MNRSNAAYLLLACGLVALVVGGTLLLHAKNTNPSSNSSATLSPKDWILFAISVAAFLMSFYTLWSTKLAPFMLEVMPTGRVTITVNPQSLGAMEPALSVQMLFTNVGAKTGYVDNIAIVLKRKDSGFVGVFRTLFEDTESAWSFTKELATPKFHPYTSFALKADESVAKQIFFVPFDVNSGIRFKTGFYLIEPYTRTGKDEWRKWEAIEFEISEESLAVVNKSTATPDNTGGQFVMMSVQSISVAQQEISLKELKVLASEISISEAKK